jgi:hypothetical protein
MILFGALLFITDFLDGIIVSLTYFFLEGSSEGKAVLFFIIMGSILLIYPLFKSNGKIMQIVSSKFPSLRPEGKKYLKWTIVTVLFTYAVGQILEIWIRLKFGVSLFTIFVSLNPTVTTSSITHSHIFKSVLGSLIGSLGLYVPSHIHTGSSLIQYVPPLVYIIFITFPLVYITGIISMDKTRNLYRFIIALAITTSLIGMLDGGLFSTPALIGLSGLLGIYYIKKPFSAKNLITPSFIIIILIILRVSIGIYGSIADYHEITVIEPAKQIELTGYDISNIENQGNTTTIRITGKIHDKELLLKLINDLNGQCSGFFISWNFFSWLDKNPNDLEKG